MHIYISSIVEPYGSKNQKEILAMDLVKKKILKKDRGNGQKYP